MAKKQRELWFKFRDDVNRKAIGPKRTKAEWKWVYFCKILL